MFDWLLRRRVGGASQSLTDHVELVGVVDAAVLVFHHAGVVALVGGNDGLHDDGPHVVTHLKTADKDMKFTVSLRN